jgi:hypothetical protein
MTRVILDSAGRVRIDSEIVLPLPAAAVWNRMSDFAWFVTLDPLHARVSLSDNTPGAGVSLVNVHRFGLIYIERVGRILWWKEGVGFCFSDLSARGRRVGFPHVLSYRIVPCNAERCRLCALVRGRWTLTWLPRPLARAWLRWVQGLTMRKIENAFLMLAIAGIGTRDIGITSGSQASRLN